MDNHGLSNAATIEPPNEALEPSNWDDVSGYAHMAAQRMNDEDLCLFCGNHGQGLFVPDPNLPRAVGIDVCGVCNHYAEFCSVKKVLGNIESKAKVLA